MNNRTEFATAILHLVDNTTATLKYYLLSGDCLLDEITEKIISYGIEVELMYDDSKRQDECFLGKDITCDKESIEKLLLTLKNGLVTPTTAQDVIYDYIST